MSSNFHALLNATLVATTQPESSVFATATFAATAKAAVAVLGAAVAIGAADVSVANVPPALGSAHNTQHEPTPDRPGVPTLANSASNGVQDTATLDEPILRASDMNKTAELCENVSSGAKLAAAFKGKKRAAESEVERAEENAASLGNGHKRQAEDEPADSREKKRARVREPVDAAAAAVPLPAAAPLPVAPPATTPLPTAPQAPSAVPTHLSGLTKVVSGYLKRKRGIDGDVCAPNQPETDEPEAAPQSAVAVSAPALAGDDAGEPGTKRARVVQKKEPHAQPGESVNKYHANLAGWAAFPFRYRTSDVQTQTGPDPASAWSKSYPPKKATRAPTQLADAAAFPPLPRLPPPRKSALKATAGPGPTRTPKRNTRFSLYDSLARPPRRAVPPAADKLGLDYTVDRMLRRATPQAESSWTPPPEPQWTPPRGTTKVKADRWWSHPVAKYKTYCDASVQCPDAAESEELALEVDEAAMLAAAKDWRARSYVLYQQSKSESHGAVTAERSKVVGEKPDDCATEK